MRAGEYWYETHMHTKEASACAGSTGEEMARAYAAAGIPRNIAAAEGAKAFDIHVIANLLHRLSQGTLSVKAVQLHILDQIGQSRQLLTARGPISTRRTR